MPDFVYLGTVWSYPRNSSLISVNNTMLFKSSFKKWLTTLFVWYWEISWKVGFSVQKSENCAVQAELGTLLPPCNYRKREGDIAKCHHKVQVYSDLPKETVAQSKWLAQVVALIYNPVGSCCFRYSLPTILPPLSPAKCPLILFFVCCPHF